MVTILFFLFVSALSLSQEEVQFKQFVQQFQKSYSTSEEYQTRFENFKASLARAQRFNSESKHARFGPTKFSDMSLEEFQSTMLMKKTPAAPLALSCLAHGITASLDYTPEQLRALPDTWDWRTNGGKNGKGIVTPVKDQAQCGSCWAFSTTGAIESAWMKKGNDQVILSEQVIVDCSHGCSDEPPYGPVCNQGCSGGWQWNAYFDIVSWGGLQTEAEYPYTATTGTCHSNKTEFIAPITNYTCLSGPDSVDEEKLRAYIYANGPVSVALDASYLQDYTGGVIDPWFPNWECDPAQLDHALLIVGWGIAENWIGEQTPFWTVKNSWSSTWGMQGYFQIARNGNICGIANAVSAVIM